MTTEPSQPSCQSVEERLGELLDLGDPPESDAPPSEARELLGHVRSCDRCQRSLELYRKTVAILRSVPDVPVPDDFLSWVQDGLRPVRKVSPSRWPGRWSGFPVRLAVAAMILCGLGLGAFFFQGRERSPAEGRLVADLEESGRPEAFLRKARTPSPPASASSRGARPKLKSA
ncbi:MAG: hypothetical protein O7J95_13150, partial [Planctomycetota bacterium]|nr:hypothetical protein [Planctomycetota bacterium]